MAGNGWLPDPAALAFETPTGGVESLDWLVPAEAAPTFYGAGTVGEVADVAVGATA